VGSIPRMSGRERAAAIGTGGPGTRTRPRSLMSCRRLSRTRSRPDLIAVEVAGVLEAFLAIPAAAVIAIIAGDVWGRRSGRPKAEPTVGEQRLPASRASA
jgi:hypothetical protein